MEINKKLEVINNENNILKQEKIQLQEKILSLPTINQVNVLKEKIDFLQNHIKSLENPVDIKSKEFFEEKKNN